MLVSLYVYSGLCFQNETIGVKERNSIDLS